MVSKKKESDMNKVFAVLLLALLLLVTWFLYKPGFSGGFIFDDYHSLQKLAVLDGEITVKNAFEYLSLSDTGQLKRPISVLSFLLDAQDWPARAESFKRTNTLLHLFNGVLLFALVSIVVGQASNHKAYKNFIAFFVAGVWLLHPFMVSTTLYIVQRMAMLPVTFTLLGLIAYVRIRVKSNVNGQSRFFSLLSVVYITTILSMLSKENGILFLPLVYLFESFIVQKYLRIPQLKTGNRLWILTLPNIAFIVVLIAMFVMTSSSYDIRSFTMIERLFTQFRVVTDYIFYLMLPKYFTYGVFGDGYQISKGLFQPMSTVFSLLFVISLMTVAWILRNKYVLFSFTVFFFFISHLIESTLIPLEIYYEHRNYLASLFLGLPIALILIRLFEISKTYYIIPVLLLSLIGFLSHLRVSIWSDNYVLHERTMKKFPESARAFTMTADFYARSGYQGRTIEVLDEAILYHRNLGFKFNRLQFMCHEEFPDYTVMNQDFVVLFKELNSVPMMLDDMTAYTSLLKKLLNNQCKTGHDQEYAERLYNGLKHNPTAERKYMKTLIAAYGAHYYLERNEIDKAVTEIRKLIHEFQRYFDVFENLDGLYELKEYDVINDLLNETEQVFVEEYKYKLDSYLIGDRIKAYKQKMKETTSQ